MTPTTFIIAFFTCLTLSIIALVINDIIDRRERQEHKSKERVLLRWNYVNRGKLKRLQDVCNKTFTKTNRNNHTSN